MTSAWRRCGPRASSSPTAARSTPIPATGAETRLLTITERRRNRPVTLDEALDHLADPRAVLLVNDALGPRRRADPGAEPDARRWRDRTPRAADPADGAPSRLAEDDGREPLAGGGARGLRHRMGSRSRRGPRVRRQHDPYRRRPAAADLEAPAERNRRASIASRPTPASASSAAGSRPPGRRTRP